MSVSITVFDGQTGKIFAVTEVPDISYAQRQLEPGQECIVGAYRDDQWWIDPDGWTAHRVKDYALDSLPIPCTVTIEGVDYLCDEQPDIEFAEPGTYAVSVDAGPQYLSKTFEVVWP